MTDATLDYYRTPGWMTALPGHPALGELPRELDGLREAVQNLLVHREWAGLYGLDGDSVRAGEQNLRTVAEVLGRAFEISPEPVAVSRAPADRVVSICRHFTVLYTAFLRFRGVPARVRCGFSGYFDPVRWYDHWITERWEDGRWVRDDPQIDEVQEKVLGLDFNPYDQPSGRFLTGGEAWIAAREGRVDPELFGIYDMWGMGFVAGNVVNDLACLNKVEMLPWDSWGMMRDPRRPPSRQAAKILDQVAALAATDDLEAIRSRYDEDRRLAVPSTVTSYTEAGPVKIRLPG
ncbi:MAG: transglutaminase-like domain-containing protein [bacterium]|nr:transglutaminase-like domain-containing protein [bacterium]MDE0602678.1 transglutaminase-like domain-containing protein [bacterium]